MIHYLLLDANRKLTRLCRDYDMHGPAGPTAFWKLSDQIEEDKNSNVPLAYY